MSQAWAPVGGAAWASVAVPGPSSTPCLGWNQGSDRCFGLEPRGSLRPAWVTLTLREAGGRAGPWPTRGGRPPLEPVLGGWLAPGWPDCRQAQACLPGVVPHNSLPGGPACTPQGLSPPFPLETRALPPLQDTSASGRTQTSSPRSPLTSMGVSACEVPSPGCPSLTSVGPGVVSLLPGSPHEVCPLAFSLSAAPVTLSVSGAQIHVPFMTWRESQGWGWKLARASGLTQWLKAGKLHMLAKCSHRAGLPVQLRPQKPLGEGAGLVEGPLPALTPRMGARLGLQWPAGRIVGPSHPLPAETPLMSVLAAPRGPSRGPCPTRPVQFIH